MKLLRQFFLIALITLLLLEVTLRITGLYRTQSEKQLGKYETEYGKVLPSWYHTWSPNKPIVYDQPEIQYSYPANSIGVREKEWAPQNTDSSIRILFLGDSFTEGDGTTYDSSMPRFLEKKLQAEIDTRIKVYNAGVCGSNPFFNYMLYRDKLKDYEFDKVVLCINTSDLDEIALCGGFERFKADGTTRFYTAPWYAGLFRYSHVVRMVVKTGLGRNDNLTKMTGDPAFFKPQIDDMMEAITKTRDLANSRDADFLCVIHPFPFSFEKELGSWQQIRLTTPEMDKANVKYTDLYPAFETAIKGKNYLDYSWPINRHFNGKGYDLYAQLLFAEVQQKYPEFWRGK